MTQEKSEGGLAEGTAAHDDAVRMPLIMEVRNDQAVHGGGDFLQFAGRLSVDHLRHHVQRKIGRTRQENMRMIFRHRSLQNLVPNRPTNLSDQSTNSKTNGPDKTPLRYFVTHTEWYVMSKRA